MRSWAIAAALLLSATAAAQCEKDTDCKGERVCDQGKCVYPREQTAAPTTPPVVAAPEETRAPPPVQRPTAERRSQPLTPAPLRTHLLGVNVLPVVLMPPTYLLLFGIPLFDLNVEFETAISGGISFYVQPEALLSPVLIALGAKIGLRYYFGGRATEGFWAGADVYPGGAVSSVGGGFALQLDAEGGYTFVLSESFSLAIGAGVWLAPTSFGTASSPVGFHVRLMPAIRF